MITDLVREVGGTRASVTGLLGSGVDPHLYKPTRSDIAALNGADVVFYNGLLLEGKMTDALIRVASSGRKVVAVTDNLDPADLLEPAGFQGHADPHVWMDPALWIKTVEVIKNTLAEADPAGSNFYKKQALDLLGKLQSLDEFTKRALATIPDHARVIVTAHDAFNYFGRRYGFEVIGIQGISTESEAGVQDIERIVKLLADRKIGAVFVESTVSDRNIRALIEGVAARGQQVKIGGQLFSDAMGNPGTYEGTYIGMIDHNVTTITRALGGQADERGHLGKLTPSANTK